MTIIDLVGQPQRTSVAEQLTGGTPYALVFGGQGGAHRERIAQLRGTYGREIDADRLWADALDRIAPVLAEVAPWWPADPADPAWHPRVGDDDARDRWTDPAASIPNIAYAQLLELRALAANRLDVAATPPVAVAGHSQGILGALAAAEVADHVDLLALAHLIGAACGRTARHAGLVPDGTGSPMVAVTGHERAELNRLIAAAGLDDDDPVVVGVTNGPGRHVLVGRPERLARLRTSIPQWDPLPVGGGFHHPALAPAVELVAAWAERCGITLGTATTVVANQAPLDVAGVAAHVVTEPFDWPATVERALDADPSWLVDMGPDAAAGRLTRAAIAGRGIGVCAVAPSGGVSPLVTPGAAPQIEATYASFAPQLLELDDGTIAVETRLTRLTGHPAFVLAGMTPTTVDAGIVAAAANAGIWSELAGGGQVTAGILRERLTELGELLHDGVGVHFNTLHLDPYLWGLHLGPNGALLDELRRGAPIRGVTVSAGIPPAEEAAALIETLTDLGVETVTFKPGTRDGIAQVVEIARLVAPRVVIAHIEGGRAGGHHSWEDLDQLLLGSYAALRSCENLVICAGGGIGTPAVAATYLDGSWAARHGRPPMPLDGILVGTAAMACAEATTSPQVKALLARCAGTADRIDAGSSLGGVASGRSQLGADIHELDNAASRTGRLLDEVAGDADAVARRHDEIVAALDRTAKPYFGDLATMTYDQVLTRFVELCAIGRHGRYEDGAWLDVSWRRRFVDLLHRAEARLVDADHGPVPTRFATDADVDDPTAALDLLRRDLPDVTTTLLHPADVHHVVEVCRAPGKPVPFVPVIDAEVRRWWRSDSLWQAHDDRYDADGVVVIPGPAAVAGIERVDEPVADLFARFEYEVAHRLARAGAATARRSRRRTSSLGDHPVAAVLGEPAVTWNGRRRRNPAVLVAAADDWSIDDRGVATAPGGRARLVPAGDRRDVVHLEVTVTRPGRPDEVVVLDLTIGAGLTVSPEASATWSAGLARIAAGTAAGDDRDHAALFGTRRQLPDAIVGRTWPAIFAAITPDPVDDGFLDLVHLDHTIELLGDAPGSLDGIDVHLVAVSHTPAGRVVDVAVDAGIAKLHERFLVRGDTGSDRLVDPAPIAPDAIPTERRTLAVTRLTAPANGVAMATISGDHNPLHTSTEVARIAGFASPVVHGMWTSAAMQQAARAAGGGVDVTAWQVRFLAPVGYGDAVELRVVRVARREGADVVEVTAHTGGGIVAQAQAVLSAPRTAYGFPGQGIQRVGMGLDAISRSAAARWVWERADRHTRDRLGFSILHVVRDNPVELTAGGQTFRHPDGVLFLTQFTQVAMATLASAQVAELREAGGFVDGAVCCGHSVGEYNALAAVTGILALESVVELVYHRGLAMHRLVPRDADGASRYRMAAARPSEAGLDEAELVELVAAIRAELDGEFLQVVNYNLRGRQYAIAGTGPALDRLEQELEERRARRGGKGVFVTVPGIDVPFHSDVLRDGVDDFRTKLDAILPEHVDPALLVGRYIPNLVPRLFTLDREFVIEVADTVPSVLLADVLDAWDDWHTRPGELCRVLLLELLAWQFASPVRWIETQDLLFGGEIERFVEIGLGSQPTITGLARQTLAQRTDDPAVTVLNIDLDRATLFGEDVDPPETEDDEPVADHPATEATVPAPAVPAVSAPAGDVADLAWGAADGLRLMLAWWTRIRPDQLGAADSIETLCDGASSRRNQLLMDLGAEFGLGPIDGAAEADLATLIAEVAGRARTYRALGPVLRTAVDEQLRRVTGPAKARPSAIADRVASHWGLGDGWALAVAATVAAGTRSGSSARGGDLAWLAPTEPSSPAQLDALVDAAVTDVAAARGVVVSPRVAEASGAIDAAAAAALLDTITGEHGVLADLARVLDAHLDRTPAGAAVDVPADRTVVDAVERELGTDWARRVQPVFDVAATLVVDDRWAGQREDLVRLASTEPCLVAERDAIQQRLAGGLADGARVQATWWRDDTDDADLARRLDALLALDVDTTYAGEVALVTGASPRSIAEAVVVRLLAGGATVVATSSGLDEARVAAYRELYHRHAAPGAALWLAPANLASNADVDALVEWITSPQRTKPALTPTLLFPFAAPAVSGDLTDTGPRAELEMRVLLWSVERTIARLAAARATTGRADRLRVVLPGSPNRGMFGGDGAYGEAKAALDALMARSASEPWGRDVSVVHAVIGWVRGTGLMGANDPLVDTVEAAGIRTWSPEQMAGALLERCTGERGDVDLSGGLLGADLDLRDLAASVEPPAPAPEPEAPATIDALPAPPRAAAPTAADWPEVTAELEDTVVIVGLGEVGPLGSARTRFDVEVSGRLSAAGVAELAWTCGLVRWEQQPTPGFYDAESGDLVPEHELVDRYHDRLMDHSGIRVLEDDGRMDGGTVPLLASVYLDRDLTFTVDDRADAEAFASADPERTTVVERADGAFDVTRNAGTEIRVPRRIELPRHVGAQLPAGFDPEVWGLPGDMVASIDRVAAWNLVATVDAFLDAGIEPAELLQWVHPSEVANTQGTGIGGISAIRSMYVDSLLGEARPNDILQEALPNVVAAHVMQSYVGGYGSMIHPVAACATAAVSVEEAFDKIRSGRAAIVVAGGFDDYGPEGLVGFASMNATASSDDMDRAGIAPGRMSRPNDRRRAGFVEGQGGGTVVLARGDVAAAMGLPVRGVVAWAGSFSDGVNTSIPAPGLGLVAAGRGGTASPLARRLRQLGVGADDIDVVSKHDTSTAANDPNESLVHEQLAAALGRSPGNPLLVVSQKSVTGHAKGGAAAFQIAGLCQVLEQGVVPPNRSLDCVDPALAEHEHLVWPTTALRTGRRLRCGLVTSLGFGHVAAIVAVVHPDAFVAAIDPEARAAYLTRAAERRLDGERRRIAARSGGPALYRRPDKPYEDADHELTMLRGEVTV